MKSATLWKWAPVMILGPTVLFAVWRVALVVNDPSFAADETAYARGLAFDEELARRAASQALGWQVELLPPAADTRADGVVQVRVRDAAGAPVTGLTGNLRAFHNAHPAEARLAPITAAAEPGGYEARLRADRAGQWQWQIALEGPPGAWSDRLRVQVPRP
jgi:nitrogen fixation protein FixH